MGWWSLGPEDAEDVDHPLAESPPPLPVRRARGGAGRVPGRKHTDQEKRRKSRSRSPRKSKRTKSPKKKRTRVIGGPLEKEEEELNLFASIGRMMTNNNPRYATSDLSTLGTAKYPGQDGIPIEAFNNTNEAQRRANEMANAMAWLTNPTATATAATQESSSQTGNSKNWWENEDSSTASTLELLKAEEMPDLMGLLKLGQTPNYDNSDLPATADDLQQYMGKKELSAEEKKAMELQRSIEWLQNNHTKYVHEDDLEYNEEPFEKVDDGFGQLDLKKTPALDWEKYNPMENRKHAEKLAKELKQSLELFLADAFDADGSSQDRLEMKQLKDLFADWKVREDDGAKELGEALSWFKLHANNYDPVTATDEETDRFLENKRLLALLGCKEGGAWDERSKEMEEALAVWNNSKDKTLEHLDNASIEKVKEIDDILVKIKRNELTENSMKYMAKEMDKILTKYMEEGLKITDLSKMEKSYHSDFETTQSLLSLAVKRADPLPDRRLEDIVELLKSLEQNTYSPEIVDSYDGDIADRFRKLQEAMMDWKTSGETDSPGMTDDAIDVYTTIESVLEWWVANEENFDFKTATEEEIKKAQFAKSILDVWIPADSGASSCFLPMSLAVEGIKDGLALYRVMDEEEQLPDLTSEIEMKMRQSETPALSWMRNKTACGPTDSPESLDIEGLNSKFDGVAPRVLSEEEKRAQEMSSALDWLRNSDTELDFDDNMSVALSIATFKKIDVLMPKARNSAVPTTMTGALDWLRSRTTVDDDTVSSFKKIDDVLTRSGVSATIEEGGFAGALEWLRKRHARKATSDSDIESTSNGRQIEQTEILANPMSDVDRRAEQMTSALDWLRSSDASEDISSDSEVVSLGIRSSSDCNINNIPRSDDLPFVLEDVLDGAHVQNVSQKPEEPNNDNAEAAVEDAARCSPSADIERKPSNEVAGELNFTRSSQDTSLSTYEPNENLEFNSIETFASVSVLSNTGHGAESANIEQSWMRNISKDGCPEVAMTLVGAQSAKPETSDENSHLRRDDKLDWARSDALSDSVLKTSYTARKIIPSSRNPKQRSKDLEKIVQWMRKGEGRGAKKEDKYDPTGQFRRLQSLLPHRPGQDKAARARMIEGALDWCRERNNDQLDGGIETDEVFENLDQNMITNVPFTACPEGAPKGMRQDWVRFNDSQTKNPTQAEGDSVPFKRPCDVSCMPRPSSPTGVHDDDLAWRMHVNRLIPGVPNEKVSYQDHSLLNYIPHAPEGGQEIQNDHLNWVRHPWVEAMSDDETLCFDHPRNFELIPREGPSADENSEGPLLDWMRSNEPKMTELPLGVSGMMSVLPGGGSSDSPTEHRSLAWMRHPGSPADTTTINVILKRPGDIHSIPRDGHFRETVDPDTNWSRQKNESVPRVSKNDYMFNKPGISNYVPTSGEAGAGSDDDNVDWIRQPGVGTQKDEEKLSYDRPGAIRSIPREVFSKSDKEPNTEWIRHPNTSTPDVANDIIPFEKQAQLDSEMGTCDPDDKCTEDDPAWTRDPCKLESSVPDDEIRFMRPSNVRSIPRHGEEKPENDSEVFWARYVSESESKHKTRVGDEDLVSTKPRDVGSIPRYGEEKPESDSEFMWAREVPQPENAHSVSDKSMECNKPGEVRSIPRFGEEKPDETPEFKVARGAAVDESENAEPLERPPPSNLLSQSKTPEEDDAKDENPRTRSTFPGHTPSEEEVLDRPGELRSIPRTPKSKTPEDLNLEWVRSGGNFVPGVPQDDNIVNRPDVRGIPVDGVPADGVCISEWSRQTRTSLNNFTPRDENVFDRPGDIRSIPRAGKPHEGAYPELGWNRNPAWNTVSDKMSLSRVENIFDRPGDIRSIPRAGKPHEEAYPELEWNRSPAWKQPSAMLDYENVFDRPSDLRSIPRTFRPHDKYYPETSWDRNADLKPEEQFEERNVFDHPGNLRSIPRDGRACDEKYPEMTWGRNSVPSANQQSSPEETNVFDRPGDMRSIPRDGRPAYDDELAFEWERQPAFNSGTGVTELQNVFDRPGDLRSIPRDGQPNENGAPKLDWQRHFSSNSISFIPVDSRGIPRDGMPSGEDQEPGQNPDYDWSGGRPHHIRAIAPYVDWSSDKLQDAEYDWMVAKSDGAMASKKEADYDWSGARPFDRPTENTLATLPVMSLDHDEASSYHAVPDSITVFTELHEDKPRPVTGVPCAAWTMLALGAAAGGAMGSATAGEGGAVASSFATNNGVGSSTEMVYPEPGSLPNCSTDANCQIVMDGLSPVLPPDVVGLFDMPGTCQTKARDWLRTGKDILEFKAERIRQRYAMSVFFCEMDGGDWVEGDSWLSDLHECDWYNKVGLDPCNRHEQMEMLRVTDNGLAGSLPVEMFILSNLYEFTLANNLISGSLPQLFDKFKELDTLVIPFNQFEGTFPHQIWEYPDMVYLDVAYNGFSGTIPADIDTRMPNLQVVYLENNKLSGPIPETMGNLEKLHKLHLDDNKFTGNIPSTLGKPARLSELLLHDNLLTGQVPKELGDLNRLQLLTLHYNSLDEQTMDEHICNLIYNEQLELATVDKAIINCGCCSSGEESFV